MPGAGVEAGANVHGLVALGVPYELAGLLYFASYLAMSRPRAAAHFSRRSRVLTLLAAIALVGSVPLHYGDNAVGIAVMLGLIVGSIVSIAVDRRTLR